MAEVELWIDGHLVKPCDEYRGGDHRMIESTSVVSEPNSPATETVFSLTPEADRQLRASGKIPAVDS